MIERDGPPAARRLVILAEGNFGFHHGKTAVGVIRYGPDDVVAVIDSTQAGGNVSSILPGRDIPIVATLDEALARDPRPDTLLIGIAPTGGKLPDSWRETILAAIAARLDVHSGLHTFLGDDPEFAAAARAAGVRIVDYRRPPARMETAVGRRHGPGKRVILTVGTDCAIGKMSVALELRKSALRQGDSAVFVPTGQTGIAIAGWGIAVDAVVSDFLAGAAERLVVEGAKRGDLLWVEGQGAILHPIYSGVTVGLIHGSAPHLYVLCHEAGRTITEGDPTESPLPSLRELIDLHERMSLKRRPAKVVAISLNTFAESEEDARAAIAAAEEETGLPADDPVRFGAGKLLEAVLKARS